MKKTAALLLALTLLLGLTACGETGSAEPARAMPIDQGQAAYPAPEAESAAPAPIEEPETVDWDLAICQPEEAYREVEHYNIDPTGYRGMSLRLTGEFSVVRDHGKTFYYCGVRDEDGCIENLELRFPGDGSLPEGFPEEGAVVTVWGILDYYTTERDGKSVNSAVLTSAGLSRIQGDGRD
ncbi:MAG: hypothetical protein IK095_06745 [Oscillospiraceae bacterium]|nr:hypothetical protein [Oscillospiraceae bacterium]